jgi:hypothetical protein
MSMWLLALLIVTALVICSRPLPMPPRHRAERAERAVTPRTAE